MITDIPLNRLVISPRNVRRRSDPQADLELKADIEARGLLQNLVVTRAVKPRGRFAVEAGERRRAALQGLADEGKLAPDHAVPCLVLDDGAGVQEASLAENFQRLALNPADECLAFQALVEQGADAEAIARRFGLTVRFVEGRLRLAGLAPVVFEALGAGEISLDVAKAYAATADRERQAHVFEQVSRSYAASHPDSIRRMMTEATLSASDRRARFVGEDAYVAAGGRVERDLFSDAEATRWLDIALAERLACEKLEAAAAAMAAETGLAFVRPTLNPWVGGSMLAGLRRVPVPKSPLTAEEVARVEALEAEIEAGLLALAQEDVGAEAREQVRAQVRTRNAEIEAILDRPPLLDERLREQVGAFLLLDETGQPRLDDAFYAEADVEPSGDGASAGDGTEAAAEGGAPGAQPLSRRLLDELAMQRRDILAVHVAADPAFALDLATFLMADRVPGCSERSGSSLRALPPADPVPGFTTPAGPAAAAWARAGQDLDRSWMAGATRAERFDAFRAMPETARWAWLGHVVAATLEASLNLPGAHACPFHDHLGTLLGIDVARWWRPAGATFFDRVPKGIALDALADVGGPALAARHAKARKAELAETCERIFAGDLIAEAPVKEAALAWLPEPMRFASPQAEEGPVSAEDVPPWEEAPADAGERLEGGLPDRDSPDPTMLPQDASKGDAPWSQGGQGEPSEEREGREEGADNGTEPLEMARAA
jgi:ParB family chromosome partitioning protein